MTCTAATGRPTRTDSEPRVHPRRRRCPPDTVGALLTPCCMHSERTTGTQDGHSRRQSQCKATQYGRTLSRQHIWRRSRPLRMYSRISWLPGSGSSVAAGSCSVIARSTVSFQLPLPNPPLTDQCFPWRFIRAIPGQIHPEACPLGPTGLPADGISPGPLAGTVRVLREPSDGPSWRTSGVV